MWAITCLRSKHYMQKMSVPGGAMAIPSCKDIKLGKATLNAFNSVADFVAYTGWKGDKLEECAYTKEMECRLVNGYEIYFIFAWIMLVPADWVSAFSLHLLSLSTDAVPKIPVAVSYIPKVLVEHANLIIPLVRPMQDAIDMCFHNICLADTVNIDWSL